MGPDLLDLYDRGSSWAVDTISGVTNKLAAATPCDEWNVRSLLNHMLETQHYFLGVALGEDRSPPSPMPPELLSGDPVADFRKVRADMLAAYSKSGVVEKTGASLGIAFSDLLLHGWDLARASGQDATMPVGLAEADYGIIYGVFTAEQRKGILKPEVLVGEAASAQDRLLAYSGRDPS